MQIPIMNANTLVILKKKVKSFMYKKLQNIIVVSNINKIFKSFQKKGITVENSYAS